MNTVSRRDFIQYTSRYLKELPVTITYYGEPDLVISKYVATANLQEEIKCNCSLKFKNALCPLHNPVSGKPAGKTW